MTLIPVKYISTCPPKKEKLLDLGQNLSLDQLKELPRSISSLQYSSFCCSNNSIFSNIHTQTDAHTDTRRTSPSVSSAYRTCIFLGLTLENALPTYLNACYVFQKSMHLKLNKVQIVHHIPISTATL